VRRYRIQERVGKYPAWRVQYRDERWLLPETDWQTVTWQADDSPEGFGIRHDMVGQDREFSVLCIAESYVREKTAPPAPAPEWKTLEPVSCGCGAPTLNADGVCWDCQLSRAGFGA